MAVIDGGRRSVFARISKWIAGHKIRTAIIVLLIAGVGYWQYGKSTTTTAEAKAVIAVVERGTLVTSVAGSGQVSSENQVDIKPKASGDVIWVGVKEGQYVSAGATIAQIDSTDAQKAVRDAEQNLESAQLSFEKIKQSSADIDKILDDAFSDISNAFLDFPTIITNAETIILGSTINPGNQDNVGFYQDFVRYDDTVNYEKMKLFLASAKDDFQLSRKQYDDAFIAYKSTSRYAGTDAVNKLLDSSLSTARSLAQALKSEQNLLDFMTDYATTYKKTVPAIITTYKNNLRTYIGQANTHLTNLVNDNNTIKNAPLDIRSQELTLKQRQNALLDAQTNLANYYVHAPFSGVIAKLPIKKGDPVSTGTTIATLVSSQQLASITLNEVDVAKAKIGQKATLTFDAVPDLTLVGSVVRIDTIGTVSQGVVTYTVTIAFDAQGQGIKPGMSVSASIITATKPDVLLVSNSAIKTQGGATYIEAPAVPVDAAVVGSPTGVVLAGSTKRIPVQIGMTNDELTEIVSGLEEGEQIITRTITATAPAAATGVGGIRIPGIGGGR
jgi:HlyD family secretion protein